ncbi:MAG: methionine--tRNA ligase [Candidatus Eisenbacteria bacterium]|nr:methionine--tRNA ligase [Candidatus Eisenbacteria bacterium]
MADTYYITTAIDYVNSTPHIGTAYEKISADVFARFHRLLGEDVYFQIGNDEHSLNVLRAARERGLDPKTYCDQMEGVFRDIWENLEIRFDRFIRTTDEDHIRRLGHLFRALEHDIYQGHYEGYYCESCEAFLQEKDLEDGNCPTHGTCPSWIKEENYFFRLSKYAEPLLRHIEEHPEFIEPESRRNEIVQLIRGGLEDISVTRAGSEWGVPLPMDESQVIYVWLDALTNYVTGVGFGEDQEMFSRWWPADVHIIGKDITRFHCVIWPAMLMSAGVELPRRIYGHGFVYFKGQKLSKSRGVTVDPLEAADMFGPSALRYFLMREGTYGRDVDFTWEQFRARYDSELANDLGNLVSRATAMVAKYLDGKLTNLSDTSDKGLEELAGRVWRQAVTDYSRYAPQAALAAMWELVRRANRHIEKEKPWELAKSGDDERLAQVLFDVFEAVRQVAVLAWPVMPGKCEKILETIGAEFRVGEVPLEGMMSWGSGWSREIFIERGEPVFPKHTDEELAARFDVMTASEEEATEDASAVADDETGEEPEMVNFDDFKRLDIRIARVLEAERVEKTDKLLRLKISLGSEERQIVAGIAQQYTPDELVGKSIVVLANLEPATIRGVESQGMLLAASSDDGLALLVPDRDLAPGTKVS